jgi:hypothetical protein
MTDILFALFFCALVSVGLFGDSDVPENYKELLDGKVE